MPEALWFTDVPKACELIAKDPFALLVGFAIDQQVTVMKAFAGPYVLKQRAGTLDPTKLAKLDLTEFFTAKLIALDRAIELLKVRPIMLGQKEG